MKAQYIEVLYDRYQAANLESDIGGYDPDDKWSRESTSTENTIRGIKLVKPKDYWDVIADFDVTKEDTWLLFAEYESGDSFGYDSGNIEFIGLYNDFELAVKQAKIITKNSNKHSVKLTANNGKPYEVCCPWVGYFERLQNVEVMQVFIPSLVKNYRSGDIYYEPR